MELSPHPTRIWTIGAPNPHRTDRGSYSLDAQGMRATT